MQTSGPTKAFATGSLVDFLNDLREQIAEEINNTEEDYVLNVSEQQYVDYLVDKYRLGPLNVDLEGMTVSTNEQMIPAEDFPPMFNVRRGNRYSKQVVTFHVPIEGDPHLVQLRPSHEVMTTEHLEMDDDEIRFDIVVFSENDPEPVQRRKNAILQRLQRQLASSQADVDDYNDSLERATRHALQTRKRQLLGRRDLVAALDVPVRRREDVPRAFSVPTAEMLRKVRPAPTVTKGGYRAEPTLRNPDFWHILGTLHQLCRGIERVSETYSRFFEEELRDSVWAYLTPRYDVQATGETFDRAGTTQILMRHQESNVFVIECLIWEGATHYLGRVDELLGYLTLRDSKAAVVVFVKDREFSQVLGAVESNTPQHTPYLRLADRPDRAWFNYVLHSPDDHNLEVNVAVMLCHLPTA